MRLLSTNMTIQEIAENIIKAENTSKSKEIIYQDLLKEGVGIDQIQDAYELLNSRKNKEDTHKHTLQIVVYFGAILIGAGIFSFIASNWQEMGKAFKVIVILAAMVSAYAAGWILKEEKGLGKTGDALILLGNIIYGAGILLVGQIFNIRCEWTDGFILWFVGTLLMAYILNTSTTYYFSILIGLSAVVGSPALAIFSSFSSVESLISITSSTLIVATMFITFIIGWTVRKNIPGEYFREEVQDV